MAAPTAPLLTIPAMEKIETFVEDIPSDVLAFHGGTENLTKMLTDLLVPQDEVSEHPKKRGRPKGSKNKPKDDLPEITDTPKKRGRPAGSKNKPKEPDVSKDISETPKKRGRPAGSKNKPKVTDVSKDISETPKKRGRPAGSKNKPKDTDTPTKHTRKSKKTTAAATVIQRAWRSSRPNHPITGNRCVYGCCKKRNVDFLGDLVKKDTTLSTDLVKTPKKRGRPAGSKNRPKTPDAPVKRRRKPDQHTRKSKKSTAAATLIQRAWRASQ